MRGLTLLLLWSGICHCLVKAKQFRDLSYTELKRLCVELNGPFASVRTADSLWGSRLLANSHCSSQVIRVTDVEQLQPAPPSSSEFLRPLQAHSQPLPQVVISGEIHGNERVGPSASLFTAQLLVWAGLCAIKRSHEHCTHLKEKLYISDAEITWLAFLATKRDTFVLPAPNCRGYIRNIRTDEGVDANRDFSYARDDDKCFMSTTGKIFQALFSTVSVQILVTYHGGMVALGYEWGSVDHPRGKDLCPDHAAHKDIAESMAKFGGTFKRAKAYRAKPINSIVYPVLGGMEDWAYAAGWDTRRVRGDCQGYAGLPGTESAVFDERQKVAIPNNRAITFLVETSNQKGPASPELGSDQYVLRNEEGSNEKYGGHIPRNARLALAAIDVVEPYVCFGSLDAKTRLGSGYGLRSNNNELTIQWYVGGAHAVDRTWLSWHSSLSSLNRSKHNEADEIEIASEEKRGEAMWGLPNPIAIHSGDSTDSGQFVAAVKPPSVSMMNERSTLWLVAHAIVDQKWSSRGQGYPKDMGPQSHLVQIRTNATYKASSYAAYNPNDIRLRGRTEWLSDPIEFKLAAENDGNMKRTLHNRRVEKRKYWSRKQTGFGRFTQGEDGKQFRIASMVERCAWWDRKQFK